MSTVLNFVLGPAHETFRDVVDAIGLRLGVPFLISVDRPAEPFAGISIGIGTEHACDVTLATGTPLDLAALAQTLDGANPVAQTRLEQASALPVLADLIRGRIDAHVPATDRDSFGRVPIDKSPLAAGAIVELPLLDLYARWLRRRIEVAGLPIPPARNPWRSEGGFAVVLTHDVDGPRLQAPFALARSFVLGVLRGDLREREALQAGMITKALRGRDPYFCFDDWLGFTAHLGFHSTFYVYASNFAGLKRHRRDPRYRADMPMIRDALLRVRDAGGEIGVHYGIETASADDFAAECASLSRLTNGPIEHGRAHYWALDWTSMKAQWAILGQAGLLSDASSSPMALGYRFGTAAPLGNGTAPLVLPTQIMDGYLMDGDARAHRTQQAQAMRIVDHIEAVGGMLVLDWHVRTFSNMGPWRGYADALVGLLSDLRTRPGTRFLTVGEAVALWRVHAAQCRLS